MSATEGRCGEEDGEKGIEHVCKGVILVKD